MEHKLLTFSEHLRFSPVFRGVVIVELLVFCIVYYQPLSCCPIWRVWRYQRGMWILIKEAQTTQWPNKKRTNNDPQNIAHKTKDRVTRTPLIPGCKLRRSGRLISSCSTSGTRRGMNEERTGKSIPQVEHIQSQLWHRCSVTVNQNNISS